MCIRDSYETIVKASEGDPEAVAAVLSHYAGYVRSCAKMDGQINTDMPVSYTHLMDSFWNTPVSLLILSMKRSQAVLRSRGSLASR